MHAEREDAEEAEAAQLGRVLVGGSTVSDSPLGS